MDKTIHHTESRPNDWKSQLSFLTTPALSDGRRLVATLVSLVAGLLLPVLVFHLYPFSSFVKAGVKAPEFALALHRFESEVADARNDGDSTFDVWIFGDSTHASALGFPVMCRALNDALPNDLEDEVRFKGFSSGALCAWDYYLLANEVHEADPDLVVFGVSLYSFFSWWSGEPTYYRHDHERFLDPSEYLHARKLKVGLRRFVISHLLLRRIDYELFDSRIENYFRGCHHKITLTLNAKWDTVWAYLEPAVGYRLGTSRSYNMGRASSWTPSFREDHPYYPVFKRTNKYLNQRGIPILYYSIQVNELAPAQNISTFPGIDLHATEHFETIFEILDRDENVYTLNLSGTGTADMFRDASGHLTETGMKKVARGIVDEVLRLRENELSD